MQNQNIAFQMLRKCWNKHQKFYMQEKFKIKNVFKEKVEKIVFKIKDREKTGGKKEQQSRHKNSTC